MTELDSADGFVAELRERATIYWEKHPFQQAMLAGELGPAEIRGFVANRWYYQKWLPQKDAAVIANCPVPEVRRRCHIVMLLDDGLSRRRIQQVTHTSADEVKDCIGRFRAGGVEGLLGGG